MGKLFLPVQEQTTTVEKYYNFDAYLHNKSEGVFVEQT